jgi:hypothetical protein
MPPSSSGSGGGRPVVGEIGDLRQVLSFAGDDPWPAWRQRGGVDRGDDLARRIASATIPLDERW